MVWILSGTYQEVQRLSREEGLRVPVKRLRKPLASSTAQAPQACAPNVVRTVVFQFDDAETGGCRRRVKMYPFATDEKEPFRPC